MLVGCDEGPFEMNNSNKDLKLKKVIESDENRYFLLKNRHRCKVILS